MFGNGLADPVELEEREFVPVVEKVSVHNREIGLNFEEWNWVSAPLIVGVDGVRIVKIKEALTRRIVNVVVGPFQFSVKSTVYDRVMVLILLLPINGLPHASKFQHLIIYIFYTI